MKNSKPLTPERAEIRSLRRSLRNALDERISTVVSVVTACEREIAVLMDSRAYWKARCRNGEVALAKELADQESLMGLWHDQGAKERDQKLMNLQEDRKLLHEAFTTCQKDLLKERRELAAAVEHAGRVCDERNALRDENEKLRATLAARSQNAVTVDAETVKAVRDSLADFTPPTERAIVEAVKESLSPVERAEKKDPVELCRSCSKPLSDAEVHDQRTLHVACSPKPARTGRTAP